MAASSGPVTSGAGPSTAFQLSATRNGRVMAKRLPLPSSEVTTTSPPSRLQRRLVMASPRPVPPNLRVVEESAWVKAWNSLACCSGVMPMPESDTSKTMLRPFGPSVRRTSRPTRPSLVNLQALLTRLSRDCLSLVTSVWIDSTPGPIDTSTLLPLADARGAVRVRTSSTRPGTDTGSR